MHVSNVFLLSLLKGFVKLLKSAVTMVTDGWTKYLLLIFIHIKLWPTTHFMSGHYIFNYM